MTAPDLDLDCPGLSVAGYALTPDLAVLVLASAATTAPCPGCGSPSRHVHSHYTRTVADLPCHGRAVAVRLRARRFRCPTPGCPRAVFCERLPEFVAAHARTTDRLTDVHRLVGLALGGEAGARLASHLAAPTSPDTLLRRVKAMADEAAAPPRFVGIDDWAWSKGRRYGTIVVDLEPGRVIDLLPDRDSETVKKWLEAHPGVEVISRDRWGAYGQAASEAAPQAVQVADRWHLLKNLREAVERLLERHGESITEAIQAAAPAPTAAVDPPAAAPTAAAAAQAVPVGGAAAPSKGDEVRAAKRRRREGVFERVRELYSQGRSVRQIARELGLARNTVRRYLRTGRCPDRKPGRPRPTRLDAHRDWVDRRIAEGCTNASQLRRELLAQGVKASPATVWRFVAKRLAAAGKVRPRANAAKQAATVVPTPRQLSFAWVRRAEDRKPEEQARIDVVRGVTAEVAEGLGLADTFADLIRKQSAVTFDDWLTKAEASGCDELRRFAEGVRRDEAAVRAATTEPWSNGQVEAQVGRLKLIKRQGYGRAGFALLRARVLHAA